MTGFFQGTVAVIANVPLARQTYSIRLDAPSLARDLRPGQFVMLRLPGTTDPLLARPFAYYDTVLDAQGQVQGLDVVYLDVGKLTGRMTSLRPGDRMEIYGPLGNGFPDLGELDHVGLVAGGIGQTPFLAYVHQLLGRRGYGGRPVQRTAQRVSLYYGARSADLLAAADDFRQAGAEVHLATDDGTLGFHGTVTLLLAERERPQHLIGCGPEPMMHALALLARRWAVPCHLSLESPMACGVGICFSCVTRVRTDMGWDYCRICVEGPVFDAADLAW